MRFECLLWRAGSVITSRALPYLLSALLSGPLAADTLYVVMASTAKIDTVRINIDDIVTGKQRKWASGEPITVILPSKDAPHFGAVGDHWFNGSGSAMQRHWLRLVFSGRANVPIYAKSDAEVLAALDQTEGAVGIVIAAPPESYHVLSVVD